MEVEDHAQQLVDFGKALLQVGAWGIRDASTLEDAGDIWRWVCLACVAQPLADVGAQSLGGAGDTV